MSILFASVLIIGALLGAVALIIGIPAVIALMAYDGLEARKAAPSVVKEKALAEERISLERGIARAFVVAGGVFWAVALGAGAYATRGTAMGTVLLVAFYPLVATVATLVIGWYYERAASALLVLASLAVVAWGVIYQFEIGVWTLMVFALIGPMMTAAVLFWMARRDQEAFELALAASPELVPVAAQPPIV